MPPTSLACSIVLHTALLGGLVLPTSTRSLLVVEEPQAVSLLFEAPPEAAPAVMPTPAPAPPPASIPAVPEPPLLPVAPPQPPETQPPDPEEPVRPPPTPPPVPKLQPLPLVSPSAPRPTPEPARKVPPPRLAARPAQAAKPSSAAVAPALAPSPSASTEAAKSQTPIAASWQGDLAAWLNTHKTYPVEARRRGEQGHATVRFTVNRDGQVQDVSMLSSTGSSILDEAIEGMLHGARVPPFPPTMGQATVTVTVQIRYALE